MKEEYNLYRIFAGYYYNIEERVKSARENYWFYCPSYYDSECIANYVNINELLSGYINR